MKKKKVINIMSKFTKQEIKKIKEYRKLFPEVIKVEVKRGEYGYTAHILNWSGAWTQASNFGELIFMVNDCVQTVLDIPKKYTASMPSYCPSIKLAQKFNEFPSTISTKAIEFSIGLHDVSVL